MTDLRPDRPEFRKALTRSGSARPRADPGIFGLPFKDRKLKPATVEQHVAGLRFFYVKTLKRHFMVESLPFPKRNRKLPEILSPEEMAKLIDSTSNLFHRTIPTACALPVCAAPNCAPQGRRHRQRGHGR